jgi:hypothetical protein
MRRETSVGWTKYSEAEMGFAIEELWGRSCQTRSRKQSSEPG